jgi:hypothetical protein
MLTQDFVENWRRRERIRKTETAALSLTAEQAKLRKQNEEDEQFERLRVRFLLLCARYIAAFRNPTAGDLNEITLELERVRQKLTKIKQGIEFLLNRLEAVSAAANESGGLSTENEILFKACVGFGDEITIFFGALSAEYREQSGQRSSNDGPGAVDLAEAPIESA